MSEMFEGISTEILRTLHRQIGDKAITIYQDAATAAHEDLETYPELRAYGDQLSGAASLISAELEIRHQITMADFDKQIAALPAHDWHCMGCGADYDGDAELHICLPGGPRSE